MCYVVAPELVSLDEAGYAVTRGQELAGPLESKAGDAVAYCPEQALSIVGVKGDGI
jgi:ferredoxin